MNDKYKKYASLVLVPLTAINVFVGCTINPDKTEAKDLIVEPPSMEEVVTNEVLGNDTEFSDLIKLYNVSGLEYDEILLLEDRNTELYASALYFKLKDSSINDDVILNELENIICFGTQATCVSEEMWVASFGNLLKTISEYDNVIDYYYPLASYVHRRYCDLQHESLFFDESRISCSKIEELLDKKIPKFDYETYIVDMVDASGNVKIIKQMNMILNSGIDFDTILNELENVYQFANVSIDYTDDVYYSLFGNLKMISSSEVDVCAEYYELACYVHSLLCDLSYGSEAINDYDEHLLLLEK